MNYNQKALNNVNVKIFKAIFLIDKMHDYQIEVKLKIITY